MLFYKTQNRFFSFVRPVQINFGLPVSQVYLEILLFPCSLLQSRKETLIDSSTLQVHLLFYTGEKEDPSLAEVRLKTEPASHGFSLK